MKLNPDQSWTKPEKISTGEGQNAHAHFSPDGEWVIYTTENYGINDEQALIQPIIFSPQMYGEIVALNLKTKERIRLTHNKWEEGTPLWVE
jgi:Tol biopolymer transport system component